MLLSPGGPQRGEARPLRPRPAARLRGLLAQADRAHRLRDRRGQEQLRACSQPVPAGA